MPIPLKVAFLSLILAACAPVVLAQNSDGFQVHLPASFSAKPDATTAAHQEEPNYMQYRIALVSNDGHELGMSMKYTENGQEHVEFVAVSQIEEATKKGDKFIPLGELVRPLIRQAEIINKLQAEKAALQTENEKLWKISMKDQPGMPPPTVVVQQPTPQQPSPMERYLMIQSFLSQGQSYHPYQLPLPTPMKVYPARLGTNCTTSKVGNTMYTDCN